MAIARFRLGEEIDKDDMEAAREMLDTLNALEKVAGIRAENLLTKGNFPEGYTRGLRTLSVLSRTKGDKTINVAQLMGSVRPVLKALFDVEANEPKPTKTQLDIAALTTANFSEELAASHFVFNPAEEDV
jgi:hypothetical protein